MRKVTRTLLRSLLFMAVALVPITFGQMQASQSTTTPVKVETVRYHGWNHGYYGGGFGGGYGYYPRTYGYYGYYPYNSYYYYPYSYSYGPSIYFGF